jgi:acetolactate synthase-1/2/3 large subunit
MKMKGGDAFVKLLKAFGVSHVFGIPGDSLGFYDALFREDSIRHVLVRHEQAAAHMADAFARVSGRVGVCDASSGPGVTNLVTGLATAYADSVPVLAVATTSPTKIRNRDNFQELDQPALLQTVTKAVIQIDQPERIPDLVKRAFRIATTGRPGPVVLNVPLDVFLRSAEYGDDDFLCSPEFGRYPALRVRAEAKEANIVLDALRKAHKPVIWCGGGVITSGASAEVEAFAELTGIPVTTTYMGKGAIAETHLLSLGPAGQLGRPVTNQYLADVDFVLAIGSRFTNVDTANWTIPKRGTPLIQIDIDPVEIGKNYDVVHSVWSDAKLFLQDLIVAAKETKWDGPRADGAVSALRKSWLATSGVESPQSAPVNDEPVHPLQAMRALREAMGPDDTLICDSGFNQIWGGQYFEVERKGRYYVGPRGMGTMGFAFPAAIGAKLACPERRFVALAGDGGFMMLLHELETSIRMKTPVVVCVLNNGNLEYCRQAQIGLMGGRLLSTDFTDTNFAEIAKAFGARGVRVTRSAELCGVIREALEAPVTTVVEIVTPQSAKPDGVAF